MSGFKSFATRYRRLEESRMMKSYSTHLDGDAIAAAYPTMAYMLGYFHMNWIDDRRYRSSGPVRPDDVIAAFIAIEEPAVVREARDELEKFLLTDRSESELARIFRRLYVNLRPAGFGSTVRRWLEHVHGSLTVRV